MHCATACRWAGSDFFFRCRTPHSTGSDRGFCGREAPVPYCAGTAHSELCLPLTHTAKEASWANSNKAPSNIWFRGTPGHVVYQHGVVQSTQKAFKAMLTCRYPRACALLPTTSSLQQQPVALCSGWHLCHPPPLFSAAFFDRQVPTQVPTRRSPWSSSLSASYEQHQNTS